MTHKILIVDDDPAIRYSLERTLQRDGYDVSAAESGTHALSLVQTEEFDLVLLDLRLKDASGVDVLASMRQCAPDTVVIILTGHASLETSVQAIKHGAQDYLFKPCKTVELRESITRALRERKQKLKQRRLLQQLKALADDVEEDLTPLPVPPLEEPMDATPMGERFSQHGPLLADFMRHVVTLNGQLLELSPTEFDLLAYLISEAPRVVPPDELVREVQGYDSEQWEANQIARQHVYRIRSKIKDIVGRDDIIRTVRGRGYTVAQDL